MRKVRLYRGSAFHLKIMGMKSEEARYIRHSMNERSDKALKYYIVVNIIRIKTTASTNSLLKELAKKQFLEEWTVVTAETQTAGRGQSGNHWESESGKNITCSILLYPDFLPIEKYFLLSERIVLSMKELLDQYIPAKESITIKWPNDLYFEKRKLAGILIENEWINGKFDRSIVGIGLNVNQEVFTSYASNPVSLKQIIGKETNTDKLLNQMIIQMYIGYEQLKSGEYRLISQTYHHNLYCKEGFHFFRDKNGFFRARIHSVEEDGLINLIMKKGEKRSYFNKEISLLNF